MLSLIAARDISIIILGGIVYHRDGAAVRVDHPDGAAVPDVAR